MTGAPRLGLGVRLTSLEHRVLRVMATRSQANGPRWVRSDVLMEHCGFNARWLRASCLIEEQLRLHTCSQLIEAGLIVRHKFDAERWYRLTDLGEARARYAR